MSTDDIVAIGEALPLLATVTAHDDHSIAVSWANRDRPPGVVDLAPLIFTLKFYKPLRDDPELFRSVHLIEEGAGIAWGEDDAIDMDASSVERLADEVMETADFKAFLERHKLTFEAAAAQLGVSRRLVAYWAGGKRVPRYITLACRWLDHVAAERGARPAEVRQSVERWLLKGEMHYPVVIYRNVPGTIITSLATEEPEHAALVSPSKRRSNKRTSVKE